jgi:hypothetical protein
MNSYLIKNNNNILGIYIDLNLALDYIYGLVNSNLIQKSSNIVIYEYKINSCIILQEYTIDLNYKISTKSTINYYKSTETIFIKQSNNKYETDSTIVSSQSNSETLSINTEEEERLKKKEKEFINKQNILGQDRINVVHNINLLKEELKKKKEKLNQYDYDLELYNKFKNSKSNNSSFVIPIMFEQKYDIFYILDNQNKLSYENFIEKYRPEKINTQYNELFEENISSETVNSIISEVYSNAVELDLYLATNQSIENNKKSNDVNTTTSSTN